MKTAAMALIKKTATPKASMGYENLSGRIKELLIGQDAAVDDVCEYLEIQRAGLNPEGRPVAVFLLTGTTGSGKTRLAEVLAKCLHGTQGSVIRVDCGEYQNEHEVAKLVGAPPGYLGHRETTPVITQARLNAVTSEGSNVSIVVFDEVEKAAHSVHKLLLGVMDKATLKLGDNTSVNFERSIIFMTSNIGSKELQKEINNDFGYSAFTPQVALSAGSAGSIGMGSAKKRLSPEFINRIDKIITFRSLDKNDLDQILDIELRNIQDMIDSRMNEEGFEIIVPKGARAWLVDNGFSKEYGARNLKRLLTRTIIHPLSKGINSGVITAGDVVQFAAVDGALDFVVL